MATSLLFGNNVPQIIKNFTPTTSEQNDGAVVLNKKRNITVNNDGTYKDTIYYLIAILDNQAAKDYSQIKLYFNSYGTNAELNFARSIKQNQIINEINKDAFVVKGDNSNMLDDIKVLSFSIPSIESKTFIEFQITFSNTKQPIKDVFIENGKFLHLQTKEVGARIDSARESLLQIKIPKEKKLSYDAANHPKIYNDEKYTIYEWKKNNIQKIYFEPFPGMDMVKIINRESFYVTTIKDWNEFNNVFLNLFENAMINQTKTKQIAIALTKNKQSEEEKIKILYEYVQKNIKYVYAHVDSNGYKPHNADMVLNNLYGDCKDQATLLATMLRSIGIDANIALVNSGIESTISNKKIPTPNYFNHAIVYVPSRQMWIDTTIHQSNFPGINHLGFGASALILQKNSPVFKNLPKSSPSDNRIEIYNKPIFDNNKLIIDSSILFSGFFDDLLKGGNSTDSNFKQMFQKTLENIFPGNNIKILEFGNSNDKNNKFFVHFLIETQVKISSDKNQKEEKEIVSFGSSIFAKTSFLHNLALLTKPSENKYGFWGLPFEFQETFECFVPQKNTAKLKIINPPYKYESDYFSYKSNTIERDGMYIVNTKFISKDFNVPNVKYNSFYNDVQTIAKNDLWAISFIKDSTGDKLKKLTSKKDIESQKEIINIYIDSANYESAKTVIESTIKQYPNNGDLYYLYGIVLGYLGNDTESEKAFEKSIKLKEAEKK